MKKNLPSIAEVVTGYPQVPKSELSEIADLTTSAMSPAVGLRAITADGGLDFTRLDHVKAADSSSWRRKMLHSAIRPDDVIVAARGSTGKAAVVRSRPSEPLVCTNNVLIIRPKTEQVSPAYLQAYFTSLYANPEQGVLRRGVLSQWSITRDDLEQLEIELPPLDEQRRIAAAFDSIVEARRAVQAVSDQYGLLLEQLSRTYFTGLPRL